MSEAPATPLHQLIHGLHASSTGGWARHGSSCMAADRCRTSCLRQDHVSELVYSNEHYRYVKILNVHVIGCMSGIT